MSNDSCLGCISVIVPVYNAAETLERCLNSLALQTYKDIEIICVNDGSTDESAALLERFSENDARFKVYHKENAGVSMARNFGLDHATGEFVMFLDSDDWYDSYTCESAVKIISDSDLGIFSMTLEYANGSEYRPTLGKVSQIWDGKELCADLHRRAIGLCGDELADIMRFDYLSLVFLKIFKRDIIEKHHLRFHDIREIGSFEDGLFNIDYLARVRSVRYSPSALYHYNKLNPASITSRYRPELPQKWSKLFGLIRNRVELYRSDVYERALNNRIAHSILGLGLNVMAAKDLGVFKKYIHIRRLLYSKELHRSFTVGDIRRMPFAFSVFYACSAIRFTPAVLLLLWCMSIIRNKSKGNL